MMMMAPQGGGKAKKKIIIIVLILILLIGGGAWWYFTTPDGIEITPNDTPAPTPPPDPTPDPTPDTTPGVPDTTPGVPDTTPGVPDTTPGVPDTTPDATPDSTPGVPDSGNQWRAPMPAPDPAPEVAYDPTSRPPSDGDQIRIGDEIIIENNYTTNWYNNGTVLSTWEQGWAKSGLTFSKGYKGWPGMAVHAFDTNTYINQDWRSESYEANARFKILKTGSVWGVSSGGTGDIVRYGDKIVLVSVSTDSPGTYMFAKGAARDATWDPADDQWPPTGSTAVHMTKKDDAQGIWTDPGALPITHWQIMPPRTVPRRSDRLTTAGSFKIIDGEPMPAVKYGDSFMITSAGVRQRGARGTYSYLSVGGLPKGMADFNATGKADDFQGLGFGVFTDEQPPAHMRGTPAENKFHWTAYKYDDRWLSWTRSRTSSGSRWEGRTKIEYLTGAHMAEREATIRDTRERVDNFYKNGANDGSKYARRKDRRVSYSKEYKVKDGRCLSNIIKSGFRKVDTAKKWCDTLDNCEGVYVDGSEISLVNNCCKNSDSNPRFCMCKEKKELCNNRYGGVTHFKH